MHDTMHDKIIGAHIHCDGCGESVPLIRVVVRLSGYTRCKNGHDVFYHPMDFYKRDGELRKAYQS